jgi:1L-myo-inositol 1-phosphate cytidylyltransferase / CDP-L-myo-inositol myo-inositolphosphotransferase
VPSVAATRSGGAPGGLSLLERQLRQLSALGHGPAILLLARQAGDAIGPDPRVGAVHRVSSNDDAFAALAGAMHHLPARFLLLAADYLVDPRLLRLLAADSDDAFVVDGAGGPEPIGLVTCAALVQHGAAIAAHARALRLDAVDPYAPELRGTVAPYCFRVRSIADRQRGWSVLLDHVQKRGLDIPGAYFDSPFENALVRVLAPTRLTPNQVTAATLALAAVVGVLFWHGRVGLGLALALVVGVLDGVDGKMARLKLATSKLGELEHVGDFFYENFWYLALARWFSVATGATAFWRAGLVLVACDLLDNLAYGAVSARTGRLLDELSPFDAAFRRVGGRRNVYVWILLIGVGLGHGPVGLLAASAWAFVTAAVHLQRAAYWLLHRAAPAAAPQGPGSWTEQLSGIEPASPGEPAVGTLVIEK